MYPLTPQHQPSNTLICIKTRTNVSEDAVWNAALPRKGCSLRAQSGQRRQIWPAVDFSFTLSACVQLIGKHGDTALEMVCICAEILVGCVYLELHYKCTGEGRYRSNARRIFHTCNVHISGMGFVFNAYDVKVYLWQVHHESKTIVQRVRQHAIFSRWSNANRLEGKKKVTYSLTSDLR